MGMILNIKDHNVYILLTHKILGYLGSNSILNYNIFYLKQET